MPLKDEKFAALLMRIAATSVANDAIIRCQLSGLPMTIDNVILFVGDFFDPADDDYAPFVSQIEQAIVSVLETPRLSTLPDKHNK